MAISGLTAETKDTSLYFLTKSENLRVFEHGSNYKHPKVTEIARSGARARRERT